MEAEGVLALAEANRATAQADNGSGLILNTSTASLSRNSDTTGVEAKVYFAMSHVPTVVYHLFDCAERPLIICEIKATRTNSQDDRASKRRVRVTSFIEGYSARAVNSFEVAINQSYTLRQLPTLFPERVRDVNELTRATLNVLVENLDGKVEIE